MKKQFISLILTLFTLFVTGSLAAQTVKPDQVVVLEGWRDANTTGIGGQNIRLLPFDVPPGVTRITIRKELKSGTGTLRFTHGVFDPRGAAFPGFGIRCWQGSSYGDIVITGETATQSRWMMPGPLYPGRWHLAQGLSACPPEGLTYRYTITFSFQGTVPSRVVEKVPAFDQGVLIPRAGWYAGDLHSHTHYSDGKSTPSQLVERAKKIGLRFLAVTDHNNPRTHFEFAKAAKEHPGLVLIPGLEYSTVAGHANIINFEPGAWFDPRLNPGDGNLPTIIDLAHNRGGIFSINHFYASCNTCAWDFPEKEWEKADALEVWNGGFGADDRRTTEVWDRLLRSGRRVLGLGGSDYHGGDHLRQMVVWVYARNLSREAIMEGICAGRVQISEKLSGARIFLSAENRMVLPGDTIQPGKDGTVQLNVRVMSGKGTVLRLIWHNGEMKLPVSSNDQTLPCTIPTNPTLPAGYCRAELQTPTGRVIALTNPVFFRDN